jgi:hypothetical protein
MLTVIAKGEQRLLHASSLIALAALRLQRYNFFLFQKKEKVFLF